VDLTILLTGSAVGVIGAALLNGFWNRRAAKKLPKTEMRADAYWDFVVHLVSASASNVTGALPNTLNSPALVEIKARLLLFGESNVVSAVSTFPAQHTALNTESAITDFARVVCEMRKSLLTGTARELLRVSVDSCQARQSGITIRSTRIRSKQAGRALASGLVRQQKQQTTR
jgi:hypothetical protein